MDVHYIPRRNQWNVFDEQMDSRRQNDIVSFGGGGFYFTNYGFGVVRLGVVQDDWTDEDKNQEYHIVGAK